MPENENNPTRRPNPTRRTFLKGTVGAAAAWFLGRRFFGKDDGYLENQRMLDPEIHIRELPGKNSNGGGQHEDESDSDFSFEERIRFNAPVFTLVHTVATGESMSSIARRYYAPGLIENGVAQRALIAANAEAHPNPNIIRPTDKLYIPIAEPAVVRAEGKNPLEEVARKYGFSLRSIQALNQGEVKDVVYLPIHAMPKLKEGETFYVTKATDSSYYGIVQTGDYNLATLLGRNRPDASRLEHGHILIVKKGEEVLAVPLPTTTAPSTTVPEPEVIEDGQSVRQLVGQRSWTNEIDGSLRSAELEQKITVERFKNVKLTAEGYRKFVRSLNTEFAGVFEEANTIHPVGIITNPEYFILHHTAQGYKDNRAGVEQFIQSITNNKLSVQWLIDRHGATYLLVKNPKQACNHARSLNSVSTGVEIMTDETRAQGSLTEKQLESALYLAYYVHTQVYGYGMGRLDEVIVGHRDINDRKGVGTAGKPDFFTSVMRGAVLPKLKKFAAQLR